MSESDYGTPELRNHSLIVIENRTVSAGGNVVGSGARNAIHCYLDFLKLKGLLGSGVDADRRYDAGYDFRLLWIRTHRSAKNMSIEQSSFNRDFTSDGDIGSYADKLETEWHEVNRRLNLYKHGRARLLRGICCDDFANINRTNQFFEDVRDALDALGDILEKTHRDIWQ